MNILLDQMRFMRMSGQTTNQYNSEQFELYVNLIKEEFNELITAKENSNDVEILDALIDLLVVTAGAVHSFGVDARGAWMEVMRSNMAKVRNSNGLIERREDGKILKPEGWTPPDLSRYISPRQ